ncbi:MAG: DUF63 family protein [Haloarculaceae archaeon]
MFLPSGMVIPELGYVLSLTVVTVVAAALLYTLDPPVTARFVVALAPWMAAGGALHALYQIGAFPPAIAPLFGAPAVYVSTFDLLAIVWLPVAFVAQVRGEPAILHRYVGAVGLGVVVVLFGVGVRQSTAVGGPHPIWPALGVLLAGMIAAVAYFLLGLWRTEAVGRTGFAGGVVVLAHVLDGVTTAIGVDVLGTGERSPLPRLVMNVAAGLPTADVLGVGWLFVVVKLAVAVAIVVLLAAYVEDEPTEGYLLLALVAAVGLGPATNNLLLFLVGS